MRSVAITGLIIALIVLIGGCAAPDSSITTITPTLATIPMPATSASPSVEIPTTTATQFYIEIAQRVAKSITSDVDEIVSYINLANRVKLGCDGIREACAEVASATAPPGLQEWHSIFMEGINRYSWGAEKMAAAIDTGDQNGIAEAEKLMDAGYEYFLQAGQAGSAATYVINIEAASIAFIRSEIARKAEEAQVEAERQAEEIAAKEAAEAEKKAQSERDFKTSAQTIEYKVLKKSPDKYIDMVLTYTGHVVQIMEDSGITFIRLEVTDLGHDIWTDVVGVFFDGSLDVYDDDIITVWGKGRGAYTYTSQANYNITIPSMTAWYVEK